MKYKITTLVENTVYSKGLQGEHGLSLLIEAADYKVLFDTGASGLFLKNAEILNIDLSDVDLLILSHGHQDHTGGVVDFLKINTRARIVCKKEILQPKYKNLRDLSFPGLKEIDESRFQFVEETTELLPGLFVLPKVKIVEKNDTHFNDFYTEIDKEIQPDTFEDELSVILKDEKSFSVISACSHRGITNIIRAAREEFPGLSLKLLLGGFHIHNTGEDDFKVISAFLGMKLPKRMGLCHCTGIDKFAMFRHQFNDRAYYNYTGWVEEI